MTQKKEVMQIHREILDFWFGDIVNGDVTSDRNELWWSGKPDIDTTIKTRFEKALLKAHLKDFSSWKAPAEHYLAFIILFDQFPLNIYRKTPKAYDFADHALALCLTGLDLGLDQALAPIQRVFFYLPLEHSESLDHQNQSVALFNQLVKTTSGALKEKMQGFQKFAVEHRNIVAEFGRFPHRNAVLGRTPTSAEVAYLENGGKRFGQ